MNPDKSSLGGDMPTPSLSGRSIPPDPARSTQAAAANVIRTQIDTLYGDRTVVSEREDTPKAQTAQPSKHVSQLQASSETDTNPYHRTHNAHPTPQADQWKEYHTAWQNYYQKYYENYYTHVASQSKKEPEPQSHYFSSQPTNPQAPQSEEELSNDQALFELRQKLLGRVQESAHKIRRSRHFIPIAAAVCVILVFVFLQYNRVLFANVAAYVSPGSIDAQNIVVDPANDVVVGGESRLIIPKINVDVPVMYDVGADHNSQMTAMESGVAHFSIPGASSHPGEIGNTAIAGHSSNDLFDSGQYKFIFAQLEKLAPGDSIYANYQGKRYTYVVTKMEVVKPSEVNKLIYPTDKPMLTLITCTPLGTALNRLLVTAEQVSPDPGSATSAPAGSGETTGNDSAIPGNSPTFFERLFGRRT